MSFGSATRHGIHQHEFHGSTAEMRGEVGQRLQEEWEAGMRERRRRETQAVMAHLLRKRGKEQRARMDEANKLKRLMQTPGHDSKALLGIDPVEFMPHAERELLKKLAKQHPMMMAAALAPPHPLPAAHAQSHHAALTKTMVGKLVASASDGDLLGSGPSPGMLVHSNAVRNLRPPTEFVGNSMTGIVKEAPRHQRRAGFTMMLNSNAGKPKASKVSKMQRQDARRGGFTMRLQSVSHLLDNISELPNDDDAPDDGRPTMMRRAGGGRKNMLGSPPKTPADTMLAARRTRAPGRSHATVVDAAAVSAKWQERRAPPLTNLARALEDRGLTPNPVLRISRSDPVLLNAAAKARLTGRLKADLGRLHRSRPNPFPHRKINARGRRLALDLRARIWDGLSDLPYLETIEHMEHAFFYAIDARRAGELSPLDLRDGLVHLLDWRLPHADIEAMVAFFDPLAGHALPEAHHGRKERAFVKPAMKKDDRNRDTLDALGGDITAYHDLVKERARASLGHVNLRDLLEGLQRATIETRNLLCASVVREAVDRALGVVDSKERETAAACARHEARRLSRIEEAKLKHFDARRTINALSAAHRSASAVGEHLTHVAKRVTGCAARLAPEHAPNARTSRMLDLRTSMNADARDARRPDWMARDGASSTREAIRGRSSVFREEEEEEDGSPPRSPETRERVALERKREAQESTAAELRGLHRLESREKKKRARELLYVPTEREDVGHRLESFVGADGSLTHTTARPSLAIVPDDQLNCGRVKDARVRALDAAFVNIADHHAATDAAVADAAPEYDALGHRIRAAKASPKIKYHRSISGGRDAMVAFHDLQGILPVADTGEEPSAHLADLDEDGDLPSYSR